MKNFKFDLNAKVAIYVPSTMDVNVPTDDKEFVNKVMTKFSEWFGGCTSTPAVGVGSMPRSWLLHSPDPGWPRHHRKGRKRGFRRRVVVRVHKATESIEMYFGMERNGLISALEVGGDHFEAGLEYYRRETRPATEAEEKEAVTYLRQRNYTHFKLSKRCALKR